MPAHGNKLKLHTIEACLRSTQTLLHSTNKDACVWLLLSDKAPIREGYHSIWLQVFICLVSFFRIYNSCKLGPAVGVKGAHMASKWI